MPRRRRMASDSRASASSLSEAGSAAVMGARVDMAGFRGDVFMR